MPPTGSRSSPSELRCLVHSMRRGTNHRYCLEFTAAFGPARRTDRVEAAVLDLSSHCASNWSADYTRSAPRSSPRPPAWAAAPRAWHAVSARTRGARKVGPVRMCPHGVRGACTTVAACGYGIAVRDALGPHAGVGLSARRDGGCDTRSATPRDGRYMTLIARQNVCGRPGRAGSGRCRCGGGGVGVGDEGVDGLLGVDAVAVPARRL